MYMEHREPRVYIGHSDPWIYVGHRARVYMNYLRLCSAPPRLRVPVCQALLALNEAPGCPRAAPRTDEGEGRSLPCKQHRAEPLENPRGF